MVMTVVSTCMSAAAVLTGPEELHCIGKVCCNFRCMPDDRIHCISIVGHRELVHKGSELSVVEAATLQGSIHQSCCSLEGCVTYHACSTDDAEAICTCRGIAVSDYAGRFAQSAQTCSILLLQTP